MSANSRVHIPRRMFLRRCSAAAAAAGLPQWFMEREAALAAEASAPMSANDQPGVALIGCGGMGTTGAKDARRFGRIVAICDVDRACRDKAVREFFADGLKPAAYEDFRTLLESRDVDAIINGTPDHWHSLINIAAANAKKDIYSEKPLTLTVDEGPHVIRAVRANGVVLQTGTQQRSSLRFRMACELVRNGRIGALKDVYVWLPAGLRDGPFAPEPVPDGLNWDAWQGQAPVAEYTPNRCHKWFRYWYDYSGGTMTDWGAHHMDIGYWAIGLPAPTRIESRTMEPPIPGGYTAIGDYEVKFSYPNGVRFTVRTTRDDNPFGGIVNPEGQRNGIRFEGTDGWIWVNRNELDASDRELLARPLPEDAERLPVSNDHRGNFFECMRTRGDPICPVEVGHRSATVCHLGAISLRTGHTLQWDPDHERFTGDHADEASGYLVREMRKPYDYTFVG